MDSLFSGPFRAILFHTWQAAAAAAFGHIATGQADIYDPKCFVRGLSLPVFEKKISELDTYT